jgi:hypothetical protein
MTADCAIDARRRISHLRSAIGDRVSGGVSSDANAVSSQTGVRMMTALVLTLGDRALARALNSCTTGVTA